MSARLFACVSLFGLCALPATASADGLVIPGFGASDAGSPRPGYRETGFPPEQHDVIGRPVPPLSPYARPTYRQASNDYPPMAGRFGGGVLEYVMTGGRPEPLPHAIPRAYAVAPVPQGYAAAPSAYNPVAATLPRSGLPDYQPQPAAYYGAAPGRVAQAYQAAPTYPLSQSYAAAYQQAPQGYAAPQAGYQQAYNTPGYDPVAADPGLVTRQIDPIYYRQEVGYGGGERPGTIIIDTPNKFLFLVQPGGRAVRYGIGVGRPGFAWAGVKTISRKAEWPDWTPPAEMLLRRPDLPRHMAGGIANPLGARALYLGSSLYRIHGTNEPYTIGTNVSSGCIRMMNQDVEDLYGRVGVGTRVIVL